MKIFVLILFSFYVYGNEIFYYDRGEKYYITPLDRNLTQRSLRESKKEYINKQGKELKLNDTIIVKFKSKTYIEEVISQYKLSVFKTYKNNILVFKVYSDDDPIKIANDIYESGVSEYSYPNFSRKSNLR